MNLRVNSENVHILRNIMDLANLKSEEEVLENAVALLNWAIEQRAAGKTIASVDPLRHEYQEIQLDALDQAAEKPTPSLEEPRSVPVQNLLAGLVVGVAAGIALRKFLSTDTFEDLRSAVFATAERVATHLGMVEDIVRERFHDRSRAL